MIQEASPTAQTPGETPAEAEGAASLSSPTPAPLVVATPVLKQGEVITWIRVERPRLELGQILVGSLVLVSLTVAAAIFFGILLGHLRSKRSGGHTHGAGGLDLR